MRNKMGKKLLNKKEKKKTYIALMVKHLSDERDPFLKGLPGSILSGDYLNFKTGILER